jgi:hypothetical protein
MEVSFASLLMPCKVLSVEGTGNVDRRVTTHENTKFWKNQNGKILS